MVLKFIDESQTRYLKTIFYGIDGTGKSTGAKIYCESRGLHPVVIDFDYTNHTGLPRIDCEWQNDREVISGVIEVIRDIEKHPTFDTLIIDGVGTLNELLLPKGGKDSRRTYLVRTQNFKKIWKVLLHAKIHFIFIGQKDMIVTEDNESSKFAELINNMVDYKFHCIHSGKGFTAKDFSYICTKTRGQMEPLIGEPILEFTPEPEVKPISEPVKPLKPSGDAPKEMPKIIDECIDALVMRGRKITNDLVRICIQDRCEDEKELQECMDWLDNINLGGE
ncbi:AAA family ATPase [Methanobrevibacter sp.]|uniref:AAA family ATPase n=1 Tax=Methanobrevibacter sp. TaxID=66852 RepID=UPI00386D075A